MSMENSKLKDFIFQLEANKFVRVENNELKIDEKKYSILQVVDVSSNIMYEKEKGEKNLLSLINATVSHEMRNPLNAIVSQNMLQTQVNSRLREIIQNKGAGK